MEIKRQIVESKTPPSNKEVWWFDTNTEVLKRNSGSSWVPVVDPVSTEDTPDIQPGEVIETTYEEAKALYESGQMTPGQKYKFEFKKQIFTTDPSGIEIGEETPVSIRNIFPLEVWIDKCGQLRAEGAYKIHIFYGGGPEEGPRYQETSIIKHFKSKYSFNNEYIACNVDTDYDGGTTPVIETYTYDDYITDDPQLGPFLSDNGFTVEYERIDIDENDFYEQWIVRDCIVYYDEKYIYGEDPEMDPSSIINRINYINRNGIRVAQDAVSDWWDDPYIITDEVYLPELDDLNNTGYLYDLEFGNYKHSQLIDGDIIIYNEMSSQSDIQIGLVNINGDVDNRKQDIIFTSIDVQKALIKNTSITYPSDHLEETGVEGFEYRIIYKMVTNNIQYIGRWNDMSDECITDNQQCFTTITGFN